MTQALAQLHDLHDSTARHLETDWLVDDEPASRLLVYRSTFLFTVAGSTRLDVRLFTVTVRLRWARLEL